MQHRAIRHAIGWVGVVVMSPGLSWAQTTAMPGMAPARQDPIAIVGGLLTSADAKTQAWGPWYAGRDAITEAGLIPKEEAADIEPAIGVRVHDARTERSITLTTTVVP